MVKRVKKEPTSQFGGLVTPGPSVSGMSMSSGTAPKAEESFSPFAYSATPSFQCPSDNIMAEGGPVEDQLRRSTPLAVRSSAAHRASTMPAAIIPADSGLHLVGKDIKVLVDAINELRQFDLDHVAPLPELVLVGDQSAGKSSLMGALAEIHLPRSQGCCTKVPANLKTSPAERWSCTVSLQQYYAYYPGHRPVALSDVTRNRPFPPWDDQALVIKKFKEFSNKSELEETMKWAQIALLNHNVDYTQFIPGTGTRHMRGQTETEAGFSPNVVSVEISGPGLPALSFFDLPGLVQNTGNEADRYLVKVFENLAKKYIAHPNALIIYALTMSVDPVLSKTGAVIRELKANHRCMGVLTKPDTLSDRRGGHNDFEKVLGGEEHRVGHGYFVTKQPGPDSELVLDPEYHRLARQEEVDFFDADSLWAGAWERFRNRCGTECIQQYLSQQLAVQIASSIPDITEKIKARSILNDEELANLPPVPKNDIQPIVQRQLLQFQSNVKDLIQGEQQASIGFQPAWAQLSRQFRDLIFHIKPLVSTNHPSDKLGAPAIMDLTGDDDDVMSVASGRRNPPSDSGDGESPRKRAKVNDSPVPIGSPLFRRPALPNGIFAGTPFHEFQDLGKGFTNLVEIREKINKYNRPGMPGTINDRIFNEIALDAVSHWKGPMLVLMHHTMAMVTDEIERMLSEDLKQYKQTDLYRRSLDHVRALLTRLGRDQEYRLKDLFELEIYHVYTINDATFDRYMVQERDLLIQARFKTRATAYVDGQIRTGGRKYIKNSTPEEKRAARCKWIKEVKQDELGVDLAAEEVNVAAWVRAYYLTAAQRFTDSVALTFYGKFFRSIQEKFFYYLENELGVNGPDGKVVCQRLTGEDPAAAEERLRLQKEKDNLNKFRERLDRLARETRLMAVAPGVDDTGSGSHGDSNSDTMGDYDMVSIV